MENVEEQKKKFVREVEVLIVRLEEFIILVDKFEKFKKKLQVEVSQIC